MKNVQKSHHSHATVAVPCGGDLSHGMSFNTPHNSKAKQAWKLLPSNLHIFMSHNPNQSYTYAHTTNLPQAWKPFPSRRRAGGEQAGDMPADQANSPGYSGQVSNVMSTSKATVVSSSSPASVSGSVFSTPIFFRLYLFGQSFIPFVLSVCRPNTT